MAFAVIVKTVYNGCLASFDEHTACLNDWIRANKKLDLLIATVSLLAIVWLAASILFSLQTFLLGISILTFYKIVSVNSTTGSS